MLKPAAGFLVCLAAGCAGCAHPNIPPRRAAGGGGRAASGAGSSAPSKAVPAAGRGTKSLSGFEPLGLPMSGDLPPTKQGPALQGQAAAQSQDEEAPAAAQSALPLQSGGKPLPGGQPSGGAPAPAVDPSGDDPEVDDAGAAGAGDAQPAASAAPDAAPAQTDAAMPLMSDVNKGEINKLLDNRLDIGGYRVQISATDDFSDGNVLFDKTYDVMEDINLFDEFEAAGVNIDRSAYWVRIAFIDLLQIELPWTKPRLYGLNKQRLDQ